MVNDMMNGILKWLGWFVLCVVLQSTLVPHFAILGVRPDLPMIALFYLALKAGMMPAIYAGFFLGLGQDLFSASLLGANALAKSVVGFVCGIFNERVMRLDPVLRALLMLLMFIIHDCLLTSVHVMKSDGGAGTVFAELIMVTLPRAAYTLAVAVIPFVWTNIIKPPRMMD